MKQFTFLLILLTTSVYSQKLKDRIQGEWLCMGIFDSKGQPTTGKFGLSVEYLKFSFSKSKLLITESPFDIATPLDITFKNDNSFDWMPGAVYVISERIYEVRELDDKHLILTTESQNGENITYEFSNQKNFPHKGDNQIIDHGILIVQYNIRGFQKQIRKTLTKFRITGFQMTLFFSAQARHLIIREAAPLVRYFPLTSNYQTILS